MQTQSHYRLVSLRRYYKWRGVGDEMSRILAARATIQLLSIHRESMIPVDEDPTTNEALYPLREIERWRRDCGCEIEREHGLTIYNPIDEKPV